MTADVLNPVAVEQKILELSNRIAKSAGICNDRYVARLESERAYERAYAQAYMAHQGPQQEKRYAAVLATETEKAQADEDEAAYRYADRLAKALESEPMAFQSVARSVGRMYNAAGVGER